MALELKYQIVMADRVGCPPYKEAGEFNDPAVASAEAKKLAKKIGEKLAVKLIIDPAWKLREAQRTRDGTYHLLPWSGSAFWNNDTVAPIWRDQFPHPSLERPGFLAYTASPEDGMKDKQTIVKPGAYLRKYFSVQMDRYGVSERRLVTMFNDHYGPLDVKFATTEEEIVQVYDNGPDTCMKDKCWPHEGRNPAFIYAAGDLQVAYLGDLDDCSARTLVWPEKKIHSRVYGDIARLTKGLNRLGYKWGPPIGARLKKVQLQEPKFDPRRGPPIHCYVAPYIDKRNERGGGHLSVIDKGDHLVICNEGEPGSHHCGTADGLSGQYVPRADEFPTFTCERCGTPGFRELYTCYTSSDEEESESWCPRCARKDAFRCYYSNNYFSKESVEAVDVQGLPWSPYYVDMYAGKCEMTGELFNKDNLMLIYFSDGSRKNVGPFWLDRNGGAFRSGVSGKFHLRTEKVAVGLAGFDAVYIWKHEAKHHAFTCDTCGRYEHLHERIQNEDKLFCRNCAAKKINLPKFVIKDNRLKYDVATDTWSNN